VNPFRKQITAKRSAMWSLLAILVLMSDGLVFKSDQTSNTTKYACAVLMLMLIILACTTVILTFVHHWRDKARRKAALLDQGTDLPDVFEISNPLELSKIASEGFEETTNVLMSDVKKLIVVKSSNQTHVQMGSACATARDGHQGIQTF
jgi:hypothetical protein